jgi:hypothetical protein
MNKKISDRELVFRITSDSYTQVVKYRQEMDHQVLRDQLERRGSAMITVYKGQRALTQIDFLPAPGEAVPWYGATGTGYRYTLHPQEQGCLLKVDNLASGRSLFCAKTLPALELHTPTSIMLNPFTDRSRMGPPWHISNEFEEKEIAGEIIFRITADVYPLLVDWPFYGKALKHYEFVFEPTGGGTYIYVRRLDNGAILYLVDDLKL